MSPEFNTDDVEVVLTTDGNTTLRSHRYHDTYHSRHGALSEAHHVFIMNGLNRFKHVTCLHILEMGFGTGLNTVLTIQHKPANQTIHYTALEILPLPLTLIASMGFTTWIKPKLWTDIHQCNWNVRIPISSQFTLYKRHESIHDHRPPHQYDLIYYDAFAPSYQPELWTLSQFKTLREWIRPNGGIVTYCAKGSVKRDLKTAGFNVLTLPGPPGKREMIFASR